MLTLPEHNALALDSTNFTPEETSLFYDGLWLSRYALACGYQEYCVRADDSGWIRLYQDSPGSGVYHVSGMLDGERYWESFDDVHSARRDFRRIISRKSFVGARRK